LQLFAAAALPVTVAFPHDIRKGAARKRLQGPRCNGLRSRHYPMVEAGVRRDAFCQTSSARHGFHVAPHKRPPVAMELPAASIC
jgi:hypothetical protein